MAIKRSVGPYIWVTWLTKLLAGENSCEWASWFRAQHEGSSYEKVPQDFDAAGWMLSHTAAIHQCRQEFMSRGYQMFQEAQNSFTLKGRSATLGGKPDLIALRDDDGLILDVKTRQAPAQPRRSSHDLHVRDSKGNPRISRDDIPGRGRLPRTTGSRYRHRRWTRPSSRSVGSLITRLADETPAQKVPSLYECRFCDITEQDCGERFVGDIVMAGMTEDF